MDPDDITYLLIAQLHLQDVDSINHSRKGKAKQETPLTDEEYAFQLQAELVNSFLGVMEDKRIAESLGAAIDTDLRLVEQIATREQAEEDDHRYAAALSRGEPLPEKSDAQRRVEHSEVVQRRRFPPQATDHGNATASGSNSTQGTSGRSIQPLSLHIQLAHALPARLVLYAWIAFPTNEPFMLQHVVITIAGFA
ncbi:hypothetical protein AAF712_008884 [Marasmius tenuissimus]|uniref:Uncharacterized protein n=1 Tax=Marasmius tenuissimus TaxID=585030 RepID=A0ABR2ZST2_9AGAR